MNGEWHWALLCVTKTPRTKSTVIKATCRSYTSLTFTLPPFSQNFLHVCSAVLMTDTSFMKTVTPRDSAVPSAIGPQVTVAASEINGFHYTL